MFSNPFGWSNTNEDDDKLLTLSNISRAKKDSGREFTMKAGGSRKESDNLLIDSDKKQPIDEKYQQSTYGTENICVWLAAAMLVNINDPEKSNKMIIEFKKNPNRFEWVLFTKVPITEVDDTTNTQRETLSQLLQKILQYQLVKLKKVGNFLEYLLKSDTKGIYICMLHTKKGAKSHTIGIDCDNKTIFDCMEEFSLVLNERNLYYCSGHGTFGLKLISSCFSVQKQR
jgi:hypothetical protein